MLHNPILTIDCVIFHWDGTKLYVLVENRDRSPFEGQWSLPGGFVHTNEDVNLETARDRIVLEKAGFVPFYFEKVDSIGSATRDPRGWAISIIYLGLLTPDHERIQDSRHQYLEISEVLDGQHPLAFDHVEIIRLAYQRLSIRCGYSSVPLWLLPESGFTVRELMEVHQALMGKMPNKMSVHKRYVASGIIKPMVNSGAHKPVKRTSTNGPMPTVYSHDLTEPVNFAGVLGLSQAAG